MKLTQFTLFLAVGFASCFQFDCNFGLMRNYVNGCHFDAFCTQSRKRDNFWKIIGPTFDLFFLGLFYQFSYENWKQNLKKKKALKGNRLADRLFFPSSRWKRIILISFLCSTFHKTFCPYWVQISRLKMPIFCSNISREFWESKINLRDSNTCLERQIRFNLGSELHLLHFASFKRLFHEIFLRRFYVNLRRFVSFSVLFINWVKTESKLSKNCAKLWKNESKLSQHKVKPSLVYAKTEKNWEKTDQNYFLF